jgi:hypothetical protein
VSTEQRQLLRAAINLGVLGVLVWASLPNRPPLSPYAWRTAARVAQLVADTASAASLYARSRYWRAVRP